MERLADHLEDRLADHLADRLADRLVDILKIKSFKKTYFCRNL